MRFHHLQPPLLLVEDVSTREFTAKFTLNSILYNIGSIAEFM